MVISLLPKRSTPEFSKGGYYRLSKLSEIAFHILVAAHDKGIIKISQIVIYCSAAGISSYNIYIVFNEFKIYFLNCILISSDYNRRFVLPQNNIFIIRVKIIKYVFFSARLKRGSCIHFYAYHSHTSMPNCFCNIFNIFYMLRQI